MPVRRDRAVNHCRWAGRPCKRRVEAGLCARGVAVSRTPLGQRAAESHVGSLRASLAITAYHFPSPSVLPGVKGQAPLGPSLFCHHDKAAAFAAHCLSSLSF